MIERHFVQGVRLKWQCPKDDAHRGSKDGTIMNNLNRPVTPMVTNGVDPRLNQLSFSQLQKTGDMDGTRIPYNWLCYVPGNTTKQQLTGRDVLTGYMSGCLITLWTEGRSRYVGHVGTDGDHPDLTKLVKQKFAAAMPADTTGFDPFEAWEVREQNALKMKFPSPAEARKGHDGIKFSDPPARPMPRVFGLVTLTGQFYAVLMYELMNDEWCVGGCRLVEPMDWNELSRLMQ
jgi:hypothetical protein